MIPEQIHALIDTVDKEPHRFPPTLIYNEEWMLRLILSWFQSHNLPEHILQFQDGATWYSEAFLPTPFKPRSRVDPRGETRTHADAVIGHFDIERAPKADEMFLPQATQLIVAEAKIYSPLSSGTRHAPKFDQAARNVACIAELLDKANRLPSEVPRFGIRRHYCSGAHFGNYGKT